MELSGKPQTKKAYLFRYNKNSNKENLFYSSSLKKRITDYY